MPCYRGCLGSFPKNMNLVTIKIAQLSIANTIIDPHYGQPVSEKSREVIIELCGQKNFGSGEWYARRRARASNFSGTGDVPDSKGYLVFKYDYIKSLNITLKKGDKVVEIAGENTDFIIDQVRPQAPLKGRDQLLLVYLSTNQEEA